MTHDLFQDNFYQECIKYAIQTKDKKKDAQSYGALLVKDGKILGGGRNRAIAHPAWGKPLDRIIRQGYSNCAEVESLNNMLMNNPQDVEGADVYVAGIFVFTKRLFFQDEFTCIKCPPKLKSYGIQNIVIPSIDGWKKRPIEEALEEARAFKKGGTLNNRLKHCQGNFTLEDFYEALKF